MNLTAEFRFKYETHCHTSPVSKCAKASAEETVRFYKSIGYDGIFITNHFLDGNINPEARSLSYRDQIDYYFADYEEAVAAGDKIGLKVFPGVELSYKGTDFLIYGLDKEWYKANPDILEMKKSEELRFMMDQGAFVVQAHPYREAHYIDHIRLFPRSVHAVEIINSNQVAEANDMAALYAVDVGSGHLAGKIGILGEILKVTSAERASLDIDRGAQDHGEVLCLALVADGLAHLSDELFVKTCRRRAGCGEADRNDAVVDSKMIAAFCLLAQSVRAVGHHHRRDAQTLNGL